MRDFLDIGIERLFIEFDCHGLFASNNRDRGDFIAKRTTICCFLGPGERFDSKVVLILTAEAITFSAVFRIMAHQFAGFVGIFKSVDKHMI